MADYRAGLTACIIYNMNKDSKSKALGPQDFFPSLKAKKKKMTQEQILAHMRSVVANQGKKKKGKKKNG